MSHSSLGNLNTNFDSARSPRNFFTSVVVCGLFVLCCLKTSHLSWWFQEFHLFVQRLAYVSEGWDGWPYRKKVHWWAWSSLISAAEATQWVFSLFLTQLLTPALSLTEGLFRIPFLDLLCENVNKGQSRCKFCTNMHYKISVWSRILAAFFANNFPNYHMC